MAYGNVIPMDAEVARMLVRRQLRFRLLVALLAAVWLAVLVSSIAFTPLPPLVPLLVLGSLAVLAEHRFVLFGDETSMSGSIIVIVSSIFVFADSSPLVGPMLIASLAGLYVPHIRNRSYAKAVFNGCGMGISVWCASSAVSPLDCDSSAPLLGVVAVAAALAVYWCMNNLIVAGHQATLCGNAFGASARLLMTSDTHVLIWSTAAGVCTLAAVASGPLVYAIVAGFVVLCVTGGYTSDLHERGRHRLGNALVVWLATVGIAALAGGSSVIVVLGLSATLAFLRTSGGPPRVSVEGLAIVAIATVSSSPYSAMLVTLAASFALARWPVAATAWGACVSVALASSAMITHAVRVPTALLVIAPIALASALYSAHVRAAMTSRDTWAAIGMWIPSRVESAVLGAGVGLALIAPVAPLVTMCGVTLVLVARAALTFSYQRIWVGASR